MKGFDKNLEVKCNNLEIKINNLDNNTGEKIKEIETKLKALRETEEARQRRERKNIIIIKNKDFEMENQDTLNTKVKDVVNKIEYHTDLCLKIAHIGKDIMGRGIVRVKLKNLRDKIAIMKNKNN